MSRQTAIATRGFKVLLANNGEDLVLGTLKPRGLVARDAVKVASRMRMLMGEHAINFKDMGWSIVELLKTAVQDVPAPGQAFVDASFYRHRISRTFQTDITWVCFCVMSQGPVVVSGPIADAGGAGVADAGGAQIKI